MLYNNNWYQKCFISFSIPHIILYLLELIRKTITILYALMQYKSIPVRPSAYSLRQSDTSSSGAPPPAMRYRFFSRDHTTHCASCIKQLALAKTKSFDPQSKTVMVFPGLATLVYFTTSCPLLGIITSPKSPRLLSTPMPYRHKNHA